MMFKASLFLGLASFLAVLGSQIDAASGAPIEDVLKSLKGLSAKERLARVESEARKEGSVRWASSTPQAWAEPYINSVGRFCYRWLLHTDSRACWTEDHQSLIP
jgi:hypothetical protein